MSEETQTEAEKEERIVQTDEQLDDDRLSEADETLYVYEAFIAEQGY